MKSNAQPVNAKRIAALFAGYDTGSGEEEEEAIGKARLLRRTAKACGMRIVDILELPEVRKAVDAQMQPVRCQDRRTEDDEEIKKLEKELILRTRDVRRLADQLRAEKSRTESLHDEMSNADLPARFKRRHARRKWVGKSLGTPSLPFEFAVVAAALVLLLLATLKR